ncbi:MAG TPA: hypothetical protein VMU63_05035, partial [Acidimicrobiales bacterium]|nr:hypothetical protein [Acidimicrobiales bacterium]
MIGRDLDVAETGWTLSGNAAELTELSAQLRCLAQALEECAAQIAGARTGLGHWIGQGASSY